MNERSFIPAGGPARGRTKRVAKAEPGEGALAVAAPRRKGAKGARRGAPPAGHRDRILAAAEGLFSTRGFHGTTLRDVAQAAGVSVGNAYNHFADKEALFAALMAELEARYLAPDQPIPRALAALESPEGLEAVGAAARETVRAFPAFIRLIYVDVIEFEGKHLQRLYGGMRARYQDLLGERFARLRAEGKVGDVDPLVAVMLATVTYMYSFTVEHLFGVKRLYGLDGDALIREVAKVFREGTRPRGREKK